MKFYSWSRYWSRNQSNHVFERPNRAGYTNDLNEAGVFENDGYRPIIETEEDICNARKETSNECYYIPVDKVELLGKIIKSVRN